MSKFKKGDRVAIYSLQSFFGPGFYKGHKCTVKQDQFEGGSVIVVPDKYTSPGGNPSQESYEVYPEQCRRLRKKKPREWELALFEDGSVGLYSIVSKSFASFKEKVLVKEVKVKK